MVTDNEIRYRICPAAAKALAAVDFAGDPAAIRTKTKEYTGKCIAQFKTVRNTPITNRPADANEILNLAKLPRDKAELEALITKAAGVLKQVISGGPGTPPAGDPNAVGQKLSQAMKQLLDGGAAPTGAFGNFTVGADPITLPIGVTAPDYKTADAAGSSAHQTPENIAKVVTFLKSAQTTATATWVAEAEKGAPSTGKPASDAWLALQHLRAFAKNVTNPPDVIKTEVDKLRAIPGFNAGPASGRCGDGKTDAGEICDDGTDNGKPGKCNATCNGTVPASNYEPKDVEISVGGVFGVVGDCFNPVDDKASGALLGRCLIPGKTPESSKAGWIGGLKGGVKFRLLNWGAPGNEGGLSLGVEFMYLWQQALEAIDLPDSLNSKARTDLTKLSQGTFDVERLAAMVTLGASWVQDQVELTAMGGLARSWYTGKGGMIFTGSPNVTADGQVPNADALSISPYGAALALRLAWKPRFTGDIFRLRFGLGVYAMIHSKEQSTIRFPARTVTMNPDVVMGLLTIDGTFNFWRY